MKIAIDISQIVYQGTGVDTYTRNLVKELLRLNSTHKHDYILFGTSLRRKHTLDQYAQELMEEGLKFKTSCCRRLSPTKSGIKFTTFASKG